ncbi:MAG: ABC transporter permease [Bacteroidales bacterium]|nr:ABC transporter permease [Bacteroidales bacterium]
MLFNYIIIAIRNFKRNLSFTVINVAGLSVAMAITAVSLLYIINEFTFDRFHVKKDRIYRVILKSESASEGRTTSSIATAGIGPSLQAEVPEVEAMVRLSNPTGCFFSFDGKNFPARNMMYVDSSFFEMFSFKLAEGDPQNILTRPFSAVLTRSMARKIFMDEYIAVGQIIMMDNKDNLQVTGIVDDPPLQSHLQFDALVSFTSLYQDPQMYLDWNGGHNYCTYILLHENSEIQQVEKRLPPILEKSINSLLHEYGIEWSLMFQPLREVHMFSNLDADIETQGNLKFILVLFTITIFVMFIACINFINLSTAAALSRMKEVGVRRVVGATRRQIIRQFMTETVILSVISLVLAFIIIEIVQAFLPLLINNDTLVEQIRVYNSSFLQIVVVMIFILVFTDVVAGSYPALYISKFRAAKILKGHLALSKSKPVFRSVLIVFQFAVSAVLILCTLVIISQINYLLKKDLGFDSTGKLVIPLSSEKSSAAFQSLKTDFLTVPGVVKAGASSEVPGAGFTMNGYIPEGLDEPIMIHALDVDYDWLAAMGLKIMAGRSFSEQSGTDSNNYLINQTLAKQLGWTDPVGKIIKRSGRHTVIGIVEDFHYSSLHKQVEPLLITLQPWRGYNYITVSYSGSDSKELIRQLEAKWKEISPYEDFNYFFLDSYIREAYNEETGFSKILAACAGFALFIAGMGLFGLAAFITRQRSREMAIRKVFGAGMNRIFILMSTDFLKWVLIACLIAIPVAYLVMGKWLQYFVYHGGLQLWIFVATTVFCLSLALFIVLFQILRIGRLNPIDFIRYE